MFVVDTHGLGVMFPNCDWEFGGGDGGWWMWMSGGKMRDWVG